jgi:hypothetical protein
MAFPPEMRRDDDAKPSDAPIADPLSSTLGMLAGRWRKRRLK